MTDSSDITPRSCSPLVNGLLNGCPDDVVARLLDAVEVRHYAPGSIIFAEGESVTGVFTHCSGEVSIQIGRGDLRHEVGRSRPGMLLGFRAPDRAGDYLVTCVAITDAVLFFIPYDIFTGQLLASPQLMLNVMRTLSERIDGLEERLHA